MTNHDILDMIGDARGEYIQKAQTRRSHPHRPRRALLLVAILVALTATACAAKYVSDVFSEYFDYDGNHPLSDSQQEYIEENLQESIAFPLPSQSENEYSISVRSALTDGKVAYITVDIRAPEDISLEGGQVRFLENPLLIPDKTEGLVIAPDGSSPDAMCEYSTVEDGDGLANTASIMFYVNPFTASPAVNPFDGSVNWRMHAEGFEKSVFDNQTMDFTHTPLGAGVWDFDLSFQKIETREVEFVREPVSILTSSWIQNEYDFENQLLSFTLSGLSYRMKLAEPMLDEEMEDVGNVTIVMKDGTSQTLLCLTAQHAGLNAPIVLDQVDHILLANGEKLYPPE